MRQSNTFEYYRPYSFHEVVSVLLENNGRAALLAGGTELIVQIKNSLSYPDVLVDLSALSELQGIEARPQGLWIGSMTSASQIATHPIIQKRFRGLSEAARRVGGIQIRHAATLGGALCAGLHCQYRDQSSFWRSTLGACIKDGGYHCHAQRKNECCATHTSDIPIALLTLGAQILKYGPNNLSFNFSNISPLSNSIPLENFFRNNAQEPLDLAPGEFVTGITIPWSMGAPDWISHYEKARLRKALDRPLVGFAANVQLSSENTIKDIRIALSGNGPFPLLIPQHSLTPFIHSKLDPALATSIGRVVRNHFHPTPALRIDPNWRHSMAEALTQKSLTIIQSQASSIQMYKDRGKKDRPSFIRNLAKIYQN